VVKRLALGLLLAIALVIGSLWLLAGISPRQIPSALALATGLGAKLACSGHYLSGFDNARIADDLATYSTLTRLLEIRTGPRNGVEAHMPGGPAAVARYRPGLGCTLEYASDSPLDAVVVERPKIDATRAWPAGAQAGPVDARVAALLSDMLAADNAGGLDTRALLVVQDGRLLAEAYAPGISKDTPLLGWSMGKSVIAILVGRLQALGRLSMAEQNLFPAWSADARTEITVENLLQMTSGLDFTEDYVPGSDATRMLFSSPSASDVAMQSPLVHPPGSFFAYSSGTTNLLARLVYERVGASAQAQMDFIADELGTPLALEGTTLEPDASGVAVGSSFVYAPARDWARFGLLLLDGGKINGQRLLSEDWVVRATEPNHSDNDPRYGYQLWLNGGGRELRWPSLPAESYAMQGNRSQFVMVLPIQRAVVVRLGWSAGEYPVDANVSRIAAALEIPSPASP
jgi:CubicO group peptidase (beta-lactamase class C family)